AYKKSDEIFRRFLQRESPGFWSRSAEAEMWLNRPLAPFEGAIAECRHAAQRPLLDGNLADVCWQNAEELTLHQGEAGRGNRSLAMICRDDEYLYLAASFPRVAGMRMDGPTQGKRRYDEDLTDFDRVTIYLDTDRDRVTYFSFSIDQR